ncbi:outer membrane beta-barrel protein [Paucibacter sp. APW11]|uniref:Outer membrane beta-barrel protein n=1 Tax=Roseateles aquae TaxID=3077235 RepID=A0ABU3PHL2_9BURK|nr:outer membrane beta-barrel protein [Paucibacter sp. APW11]MDT9002066.1 outer membrane beta-barrel protein [Paucibacter sp. APW11]
MNYREFSFCAAAFVFAAAAHAAEPYVGFNLATPGEANFRINNRLVPNDNHPHAVKLYAGLQFTPTWAAEVGYGAFGTWRASDSTSGSALQAKLSSKVAYLAARATQPLSESFDLFGKAGLALNRVSRQDSQGFSARESFVRPMLGAGLAWKLTPQMSATVEYAHYGSRRTDGDKFTQQKLELGVALSF